MNKLLRFTFAHIIAIVSLIFILYITFTGLMFWNESNFVPSFFGTLIIGVVLYGLLIILQKLKGTDQNFKSFILLERVLLIVFILLSIGAFIPFSHFWTVFDNRAEIKKEFENANSKSENIFIEYEKYAKERIQDYQMDLNRVVNSKRNNPSQYRAYGFSPDFDDNVQINNFEDHLHQILLSENYDQLKTIASENWQSSKIKASIWNPFLLNEAKKINENIDKWTLALKDMSEETCSNEQAAPFDYKVSFAEFSNYYTQFRTPTIIAILLGLICYLLLLTPYFKQDRHTKSIYTLFGQKNDKSSDGNNGAFTLD